MQKSTRIVLGSLGAAHFVVVIALLPAVALAAGYGFFLNLVILPGLTWLGILGWRLLRQDTSLRRALRFTHLLLAPCAALLVFWGFVFLDGAERNAQAESSYAATIGVITLGMGFLAGGLSFVSLCVSWSSAFKETPIAGQPAPAAGRRHDTRRPELSHAAKEAHELSTGRHWAIRCLAVVHYALGMLLLLLAAWWAFSSVHVLAYMSHGTLWTNLPIALSMAAMHAGPLAVLGVWLTILGHRTWRGHPGVRTALMLTHGILLIPGILTSAVGVYALRGAARSAARGGGLLGSIGIFPLAIGAGLVTLAAGSIVLALTVVPEQKETQAEATR